MALPNHNELVGRHRLFNVVSCLGQSCPWTRSIKAHEMLDFLKSEVDELNHEIDIMNSDDVGLDDLNNIRGRYADRKKAMISELGDILFDVLMLEMIMRRDYGISTDEAWQVAAEKIERRTPYMKEWGDGISNANTVEDAERIWKAVKEKESHKLDNGTRLNGDAANKYSWNFISKRSFDLVCIKGRYVWSHIKCHGKLLVGAVCGYFFSHFWSDFPHKHTYRRKT